MMTIAAVARIITDSFDPPPARRAAQTLFALHMTSEYFRKIQKGGAMKILPEPWVIAVECELIDLENKEANP